MKIAITGGAGFIGHRLATHLKKQGHDIVIIDTLDDQKIDIEDRDALTKAMKGCDTVYHLAALHRDDIFPRSRYYDVNTIGTENVIAAAEANEIERIIFTSTFALYGLNTGMPDEDSTPKPFNDYGQSKLDAEKHLKKWAGQDSKRILTIIRPVVVFGEGNRGNVYTLLNQVTNGKFVMIGNGQNKKSMAYVGNVAEFLTYCLEEKSGIQIYNYADKPDLDMNKLMAIIYTKLGKNAPSFRLPFILGLTAGYLFDGLTRITGKSFPISSVRIRKFCADTTCEAERYRQTGFTPSYTLEDGITRMINHDFNDYKNV